MGKQRRSKGRLKVPAMPEMTEKEWLACTAPGPMIDFLKKKASVRKARLFAVACCRRLRHMVTNQEIRHAIELAERLAEGHEMEENVAQVHDRIDHVGFAAIDGFRKERTNNIIYFTACAVCDALGEGPHPEPLSLLAASEMAAEAVAHWRRKSDADERNAEAYRDELKEQALLFRDIFGNPFRPSILDPAWLAWNDGAVGLLARRIYEERDFDCLPILADALEDAGCLDPEILSHCRSRRPHVRGCWVVDSLLGFPGP